MHWMVTFMGYDTIDRNKFSGNPRSGQLFSATLSGLYYDINPSLNTAPRNDTIMTLSELFHQHFSHAKKHTFLLIIHPNPRRRREIFGVFG